MKRLLWFIVVAGVAVHAAPGDRGGRGGGAAGVIFRTNVPEHVGSVVLGCPSKTSIVASVLLNATKDCVLVYGTNAKALPSKGRAVSLKTGEPQHITLDGLAPNTRYYYELIDATTRKPILPACGTGTFHTARPPGSSFTFTVTADPHLDGNTDPATYQRALANVQADAPDFHIDLGDTFMTDKYRNRDAAMQQYLAQRYYFGQLCNSASLFLVLGNHDGEMPRGGGNQPDSLSVWSNTMRKRYFPNPAPDSFYTGNATKHPEAGLLQDYYAWTWGDALFVVLDPYWFAQKPRGQSENWKSTLGTEQYQWLKRTLEVSKAKCKFVFIHQLVGGADEQGRGGSEVATLYEWGGRNADGTDGFKENRPGWSAPIHQLLVQNRVSIVFHGHDHLYAKQDLDGIVYQEVPQPGNPSNSRVPRSAGEYGYLDGDILGGSGHLRVTVSTNQATAEYVRIDRSIGHSYSIPPRSRP